MVDQNKILRQFVAGKPLTLDQICRLVCTHQPKAGTRLRRNVIGALGKLAGKKLIAREAKAAVYGNQGAAYTVTRAGLEFLAGGKKVTSGPRVITGVRNKPSGMRQRIWEALRLKKRATLTELVELIHRAGDPPVGNVTENARKYLTGLARAGIVTEMAMRAKGYAPTSNGFKRFALVRDLGPRAPAVGADFITDHNAPDSDAKRIPYKKEHAK